MSYDVWLEVDAGGPEPIMLPILDVNHTSNTGGMIAEACGKSMWEWDRLPAWDVADLAMTAIADLRDRALHYEAQNPENGWGSRATTLGFLAEIAEGCRAAPNAIFRVSC